MWRHRHSEFSELHNICKGKIGTEVSFERPSLKGVIRFDKIETYVAGSRECLARFQRTRMPEVEDETTLLY